MRRPLFIAALIQLAAAVISVTCMETGTGSVLRTVLISCFAGSLICGSLIVFLHCRRVTFFYILIFIIYPITIINTIYISCSFNRNYGQVSLCGTIASIAYKGDYAMLYLKDNSINPNGIIVYADMDDIYNMYNSVKDKEYYAYNTGDNDYANIGNSQWQQPGMLCLGDEIAVYGKVESWDKARNPGNYDSNVYYVSCGYPYKCNADSIELKSTDRGSLNACLYRFKLRIKNIYWTVFDDDNNQLMNSIVLGDKYELDSDIKEMYQKSGMSHVLAISGLHISIVGMSIYRLLRKRYTVVMSAAAGIITIILYLVLTGKSVSAARAVCMIVIAIIADVRARTYDMLSALSMASILQITGNPYVVCNMSYIMSFLAMLGIVFILPLISSCDRTLVCVTKKDRKKRTYIDSIIYGICDSVSCCMAIQLALLPASLYYSYEVSLVSVVFNCMVIPLMPVVMVSGILTGAVGLLSMKAAVYTAGAASYILDIYNLICRVNQKLSGTVYVTGRPALYQIMLYAVVIFIWIVCNSEYVRYYVNMENYAGNHWLYDKMLRLVKEKNRRFDIFRGKIKKYITINISGLKCNTMNMVCIILVITAAVNMRYVQPGGVHIMMLDVGQGDCIYVKDVDGTSYLFDGGSTDIKKVGKYRIYPSLRAMGITCIDYVIISHTDADHINGIKELIDMCSDTFVIKRVVMPDIRDKESVSSYMDMIDCVRKAGIDLSYCSARDELAEDKQEKDTSGKDRLNITCMHPCTDYSYEDVNDFSGIYRISYGNFSMMMMGDAGMKAEKCMMKDWGADADNNMKNDIKNNIKGNTGSGMESALRTSILKAGHHGSKYSGSEEFLNYIQPAVSLISCGIDNRYGHPHKDMLSRLYNAGIKVYRTDINGAIQIYVDGKNMRIVPYIKAEN